MVETSGLLNQEERYLYNISEDGEAELACEMMF
jgi:hypothetical protein